MIFVQKAKNCSFLQTHKEIMKRNMTDILLCLQGGGTMVSFLQYGANTKNFIPQMGSSYQNNLKNN
jgi:hypothetical protein